MQVPAGQPPEQETVDRPERETAGLRRRACAVGVIQQPRDLGG
jgi:hypothetical protein